MDVSISYTSLHIIINVISTTSVKYLEIKRKKYKVLPHRLIHIVGLSRFPYSTQQDGHRNHVGIVK